MSAHSTPRSNTPPLILKILENVRNVLVIEILAAAQAIDLRPQGVEHLGQGTSRAYAVLRKQVSFLEHDHETTSDMETLVALIYNGKLVRQVAQVTALEL